jgi:hypothetical protein
MWTFGALSVWRRKGELENHERLIFFGRRSKTARFQFKARATSSLLLISRFWVRVPGGSPKIKFKMAPPRPSRTAGGPFCSNLCSNPAAALGVAAKPSQKGPRPTPNFKPSNPYSRKFPNLCTLSLPGPRADAAPVQAVQ